MSFSRRQFSFRHRESHYVQALPPQGASPVSNKAVACSSRCWSPVAAVVYDAASESALVLTQGTRAPVWGVNVVIWGRHYVWKGDDVKLIYMQRLAEMSP